MSVTDCLSACLHVYLSVCVSASVTLFAVYCLPVYVCMSVPFPSLSSSFSASLPALSLLFFTCFPLSLSSVSFYFSSSPRPLRINNCLLCSDTFLPSFISKLASWNDIGGREVLTKGLFTLYPPPPPPLLSKHLQSRMTVLWATIVTGAVFKPHCYYSALSWNNDKQVQYPRVVILLQCQQKRRHPT